MELKSFEVMVVKTFSSLCSWEGSTAYLQLRWNASVHVLVDLREVMPWRRGDSERAAMQQSLPGRLIKVACQISSHYR